MVVTRKANCCYSAFLLSDAVDKEGEPSEAEREPSETEHEATETHPEAEETGEHPDMANNNEG